MNDGKDESSRVAVELRQDRFLRPVTREEQRRQVRAVNAARTTFSKTRDRDGSAYFCADNLTPEETSRRLVEEIMRVAAIIGTEAADERSLRANDLELIHRGVFEPVFGEKTLDFRELDHPGVTYPVWVMGARGEPQMRVQSGSAPKQIRRAIGRAFSRLERDVADLTLRGQRSDEIPLRDAVLPAVRIYAQIVAVHPWEDGNGRTAWLVLTHTLIRCGVLAVATDPSRETRVALGRAITKTGRHDLQPLAELLVETIRASI
jgi:fido (protein-threonine AMPylation protein)